jgi:hypothetical protein
MDSRSSREFVAQSAIIRVHHRRKRFAVLRVSAVDLLFLLPMACTLYPVLPFLSALRVLCG